MKLEATLQLHLGGEYVAHLSVGDINLATKVDGTGELDTFELNITAGDEAPTEGCDPREHEQLRELFERRSIIDALRHCNACGEWLPPLDHLASTDAEPEPPCAHGSTTYTHGEPPKCADCGMYFHIPRDICDHGLIEYDRADKNVTCSHCGATRPTNAEWPAY